MENDQQLLETTLRLQARFAKRDGLLPVVVQEVGTGEVLMLGYANEQALTQSLSSGYATFWSTSRQELWTKGKTSGDLLAIEEIRIDCDQDALLYRVNRLGKGACHTRDSRGNTRSSCFYRRLISETTLEFLEDRE